MPDATRINLYREVDPSKKNIAWADMEISQLRRDWMQIVNPVRATKNRRLLLSTHSMEKIKAGFKDKKFKEMTEFIPNAVWENIRNVLTSEMRDYPPMIRLRAIDPSAIEEKKDDLNLLKNRKFIEGALTGIQKRIGYPAYKVPMDQYNSNVDEFDQMGMNDQDPDDLNFFFKVYQRMNYEIHGQSMINEVMRLSKVDEWLKNCIMDILAVKQCCYQTYVSELTGEIKMRHLFPEICYGVLGKTSDGSDDICKGWQEAVTLREWLEFVGNEFDWDRDWQFILWALNHCNGTNYTGFIRNGIRYDTCINREDEGLQADRRDSGAWGPRLGANGIENSNLCEWTLAYTYKVYSGYIEWMSIDAESYKVSKITNQSFPVPYHYRLGERSSYEKKNYFNQTVYKSYFLATSVSTQFLFKFGKLFFQRTEGQYEELAQGSLVFYREEGLSAVDISEPYITLAEKAFYKMLWAVDKAKPRADVHWLDEMIQIAKYYDKQGANDATNQAGNNMQNILLNLIQFEQENLVKVRTYPKPDGRTHLNPAPTNDVKENGLDPIYLAMQTVLTFAENQIIAKTFGQSLRMPQQLNPKESIGANEMNINASRNSSGYVYYMIGNTFRHNATMVTLYAQDILKFPGTLPYKWLARMAGDDSIKATKLLGDFAAHKYGIFAEIFNTQREREKIEQWTEQAAAQKEISFEERLLINAIKDPEKAGYMLAYFKQKGRRREQQKIQQAQQFELQKSKQEHDQEMEKIQMEKGMELKIETVRAQATVEAARLGYQKGVDVKQLQIDSEPQKQSAKTEGQKEIQQNKENLAQQRAFNNQAAV